ncbi:MAG: fibrobacter succinogenes major paralogous domain-containing protein [Bacteroidales bacterium]|nr:fibrobacter succinogenes major paralogous domain-containing protein [Bacteroidales bacterium]
MTRKTNNWLFLLVITGVLLVLVSNCKKDNDDDNNHSTGTVTDIDGNIYHTVRIGTQVWMVENLKTTRYRNGDSISLVTDEAQWANITTGAYCNYDGDANIANTYGRMYNWYAVFDSRNIAPVGSHVPSAVEWKTLVDYFGGVYVAASWLKESGTTHWQSPNTGATGESGFLALPGGYRGDDGVFYQLGNDGYWWTSIEHSTTEAWARSMYYCYETVYYTSCSKSFGFSVRCIKDNE